MMLLKLRPARLIQVCRRYSDAAQREFLASIPGGAVRLAKNEQTGIATVTIDHPEKRSALTGHMMVELRDVVSDLEQWTSGRGVVVCGSKGHFCSGGDLDLMRAILNPQAGAEMSAFMQNTMTRMYLLPLVTVAMMQGVALGGGAELAVGCDFRLSSEDSKFGMVQARIGVSPGWGGGARLVQLVGRTLSLDLLASGRVLKSDECVRLGISQSVVPEGSPEMVTEAAHSWLEKCLGKATAPVIHAAKRVVVNGSQGELQALMQGENDVFRGVWGGPAHALAMEQNIKHTQSKGS